MIKNNGFTLVEILVAIAILAVLSTLGYAITINFYKSYAFNAERDTIVSVLQKSRAASLANINQSAHGVRFQPGQFVAFQGASYDGRDAAYDEIFPAGSGMISSGMAEVVFSQLSAETAASSSLTLTDGVHTAIIGVNTEGQIDW